MMLRGRAEKFNIAGMSKLEKKLLSGNEAIALAALHSGCALGVG